MTSSVKAEMPRTHLLSSTCLYNAVLESGTILCLSITNADTYMYFRTVAMNRVVRHSNVIQKSKVLYVVYLMTLSQ
jgi:hypothetical protein